MDRYVWRVGSTVLVLLMVMIVGYGSHTTSLAAQKDTPAAAAQTLTITVAPVEARTVQRTVETTGSLLAWEEVVLNTVVQSTVVRLLVDLGDRVQPGQVVAELDKREFALAVDQAEAALRTARDNLLRTQAQVEASRANLRQVRESIKTWAANDNKARATLEMAQANLDRNRQLLERQLIAASDFDTARTQYETMFAQYQTLQVERTQYDDRVRVAEAQLQSDLSAVQVAASEIKQREAALGLVRKKLGDATLLAPISGAIARRHINPGEFLKENTAVFTIVRSDPLKYTGTVPERAALAVQPRQTVRFQVDAAPGQTFEGRVTRVSPSVDVTTRTVALEAEVPNTQGALKPGLFARGVVEIQTDTAIPFIPERALYYFVGITKVFVVTEGKVQERQVKTGRRDNGMVEILAGGVNPGERVATSALSQLFDGASVKVVESVKPSEPEKPTGPGKPKEKES